MIKITDREWSTFRIEDIFDIRGTITTHPSVLKKDGQTPRITCAATDNGLDGFYQNKPTEKGKVLTVDSATVGFVAYQEHDFIATDHVEKLVLKHGELNRYTALFIKMCIDNSKEGKFGYGYKFAQRRIKRQSFMLPVDANNQPDWNFMEAYMREQETSILKPAIEKLHNQLEISKLGGGKIESTNWKEFDLVDIFTDIKRGKRFKKADHTIGAVPYISSTFLNNGVDGFIENKNGTRTFKNCLTIANSGSVGSTFYHPYMFIASDHVTSLKKKGIDDAAYLFLSTILSRLSEKYSFNREINDNRIQREKVLLPTTENGDIDFAYMLSYMRNLENETLSHTIKYFERKIV